MDWTTYYDRFHDWEESTQLRHLSTLTDFGPSSQICEIANEFFEKKSANRLIRKALTAGVRFTPEEVLDLDGVVDETLMLPLIKSIPSLTAEELEEFTFWLSKNELQELAKKNHIPVDESGYVVTPEDKALELEIQLEEENARIEDELFEKELEQIQSEQAAREREKLFIARILIIISRKHRRERRQKRQGQ